MELTPSQLSSLDEMGIPVWMLRSEQVDVSSELYQLSTACLCLVLIDADEHNQKISRLLHAMLYAIGLTMEDYDIIKAEHISQLGKLTDQRRVLLVFGEDLAQSLWGTSIRRGMTHKTVNSEIETVISFSLDELLASPKKKALAWHDLQLAKQIIDGTHVF